MKVLTRIRDIRKEKKISQKQMAEKLNISQPGYQKIEQGINVLSIDRFLEICNILEIESYNELLPAVNAEVVVEIEKVLDAGWAAFKNIKSNSRYMSRLIKELVDKIKASEIDTNKIIEELEFTNSYLSIIAKESSDKGYQYQTIKELMDQVD